jgi:hypothetical protein
MLSDISSINSHSVFGVARMTPICWSQFFGKHCNVSLEWGLLVLCLLFHYAFVSEDPSLCLFFIALYGKMHFSYPVRIM